jgi:alpha-L-rhamnosidase
VPITATPAAPTIEHHREPFGIGEASPRLSWKTTAPSGWRQAGYEFEATLEGATITSGRFDSSESVLVEWPFEPLESRARASVRVRLWGSADGAAAGNPSPWSAATDLEIGLLDPSDWQAAAIGASWNEDPDSDERRPPLVRRSFVSSSVPLRARLYVTAHGLYEVELNGKRVGREAMAPGWTVYSARLKYATYDVTDLIVRGDNAIGSWLGDGWYRGRLGWRGGFHNVYGNDVSLFAQLELVYADGSTETVATDETWRCSEGPIIAAGNYDGETYDARVERAGWSEPGFDDAAWQRVQLRRRDPATLVAPVAPPVRCTEELLPVRVLTSPTGARVLDFGQNLVGRIRITVAGSAGSTVTLSTAEVLQEGEIYTRPLRSAKSTDTYTLAGRSSETWEPRFTIHGFRYAQVDGWPGDLDQAVSRGHIVARVYHTDMQRTGWFESSDPSINRLHENVVWGMRGNFVDIPTDCPQRDERVGWTGDIQVFAPTASFLYDCSGMLDSWLRDLAIEQLPDGTVPWYVPVVPSHYMWTPVRPGAVWGDAAVLTPWTLYERFADRSILERQFDSARKWVDLVDRFAGDDHLWNDGFQLGDWLDPTAPPQDPADARTDRYLVATAYFAWSAAHLSRMAATLGRADVAAQYSGLAEKVRAAFLDEYRVSPDRLSSDAQTAYSLAIQFGLVPDDDVALMGGRLAELVTEAGNRIATGFAGTPVVSDALTTSGHVDRAYDLLFERGCPSWLYAVDQGATTVWERWDALLPDGSVNPGTMTSFNHYALGAVADWMHRTVAGLAPAAPGYRSIRFSPRPGGGLTSAAARHESPYGEVAIAWRLAGGGLELSLTVPTGATAVLDLAGSDPIDLRPGIHSFVYTDGVVMAGSPVAS